MPKKIQYLTRKYWNETIVFTLVVIILQISNSWIKTLHSVPDELGAISGAAYIAGYNWGGIWSAAATYYGVIPGLIFTPLFLTIKDPIILYQAMLFVIATLIGFTSIFIYKMACYFFPKHNKLSILLAVASTLLGGWRFDNVMNEWALYISTWICFYSIFKLMTSKTGKTKFSIILILGQMLSIVAHTRGIIIVLSVNIALLLIWLIRRTVIVNLKIYLSLGVVGVFLANASINIVQNTIYKADSDLLINSANMLAEKIVKSDTNVNRFSLAGLRGFFDVATGNVYAIFITTFGTSIIMCIMVCRYLIENGLRIRITRKSNDNEVKEDRERIQLIALCALFPVVGLVGAVVGHSLLNMSYAVIALQENVTTSMYLYPRYFGNFFSPLLFLFIIYAINYKRSCKFDALLAVTLALLGSAYAFRSFLFHQSTFGGDVLDAWRVLYPLNFQVEWRTPMFYNNYLIALFIVILVLYISINVDRKKQLILLSGLIIYQYLFLVVVFDRGYTNFVYDQVNKTYEVVRENLKLSEKIKSIAFVDSFNARSPFVLQYLLPEKSIRINDSDYVNDKRPVKADIYFTNRITEEVVEKYDNEYKYIKLDTDEYLITDNKSILNKFKSIGYHIDKLE